MAPSFGMRRRACCSSGAGRLSRPMDAIIENPIVNVNLIEFIYSIGKALGKTKPGREGPGRLGAARNSGGQPRPQFSVAGMSSLATPGRSQAAIASLIASMAGMPVKLLRQTSTTRRSGIGSSKGT